MKTKYKLNRRQAAWVAALRSGKYKQTREYLHDDKGFCCLGVACDLAIKRKWAKVKVGKDGSVTIYGGFTGQMPYRVKSALGFRSVNGDIHGAFLDGRSKLDRANDNGASFRKIASFCEKNPEAIFTEESLIKIAPKKRAK